MTKKEIHKALRGRIAVEQAKLEIGKNGSEKQSEAPRSAMQQPRSAVQQPMQQQQSAPLRRPTILGRFQKRNDATPEEKKVFKDMLENLVGTRGAHILDEKLNILGKVPLSELQTTMKSLTSGVYAIVFDGPIDRDLVMVSERANVKFLIGMDSRVKPMETRVGIMTIREL